MNREQAGFFCVDKPAGMSSFAVVTAVRRKLRCAKAGHAGTLDPAASGLLVLALGDATRVLPFLPLEPKVYRFGVRFGSETDTLDTEGTVVRSGGSLPPPTALEDIMPRFRGAQLQVPPQFSAVKIRGVRAYRLARQGKTVEIRPRRILISSLTLLHYDAAAGEALLEVSCSGGTYVRSLARDIAEALGTFGHASSVRRIAAGNFHVDNALPFEKIDGASTAVIPIIEALCGLPHVRVDSLQIKSLVQGNDIVCEGSDETLFAFDEDNRLAAVLKRRPDNKYHPEKVFIKKQ